MITPEQIVDAIEESMFDCYPQWRELTPSDLPIVAERIANALTATEPEDVCNWTQEDWDSDMWSGSCGACWSLNDGTPEENDMKYCTNCGKRLVQHLWLQQEASE